MWEDLVRLLTLQDANTRVVLAGTGLLGLAAGVIGSFAVLRGRALVGDAVAHAALPGIVLAFFAVGERDFASLLLGALVMGVVCAGGIALVRAYTRVKEDTAIAVSIGGFFGLGIVLSRLAQNSPEGNKAGLDGFIYGKAASMIASDAALIALVAGATLACVAALYKELKVVSFDRDFAQAQGWPVVTLDLLVMVLICVVTVAGLPAVGIVLIVALLVIPAAAARFWTDRLGIMLTLAGAIGMASGVVGTAISATAPVPAGMLSRGWPTGPAIVLCAGAIFGVSLLAAPRRGLVAAWFRRRALQRRIHLQNLLRAMHEAAESRPNLPFVPRAELVRSRGWSPGPTRSLLRRARRMGLVEWAPGRTPLDSEVRLTRIGAEQAAGVVRAHRLWELFLIEHAEIAPDHVDRDADQIEHLIPPELLRSLEEKLSAGGREAFPASPHPLGRDR
jgi:manganese/zinc/iron transport system permease protein